MLSMWKRSPLILVTNFHKSFRLNICLLENRNLCTPLQTLNSKTRLPQPILPILFLISTTSSIASTIAYMVESIFDWVLLGSSVIGSSLGYSVIGSPLGAFLESLVIGSS